MSEREEFEKVFNDYERSDAPQSPWELWQIARAPLLARIAELEQAILTYFGDEPEHTLGEADKRLLRVAKGKA